MTSRAKARSQVAQLDLFKDPRIAAAQKLSPQAARLLAIEALQERAAGGSVVEDWAGHCLENRPHGRFDQDAAFVSYWGFTETVDLPMEHRLTYPQFAEALGARGHTLAAGHGVRIFRNGARLRSKFSGIIASVVQAPIGEFIAECCQIGGPSIAERGKSTEIHRAYVAWVADRGGDPVGITTFGKALKARGFRKIHSDGRWWEGLRLADRSASAGSSDGASAEGD